MDFFHPSAIWAPANSSQSNNNNNQGSSEMNFTPLFRLLDDYGRYSSGTRPGARAAPPTFQPKFDVRETKDTYELHGEMPGAKRENIHIEFTDPQTIQIRGRIERSHTATNDNARAITEAGEVESKDGNEDAISDGGRATPSTSTRKATVQDEAEADAEEKGTSVVNTPATSAATPAGNRTVGHHHSSSISSNNGVPKKADFRYWVTERSIGEFSRTFNLPHRVDQDSVTASLKDGVLSVVVPKSKKHEARRIVVG